MNIDRRVGRWDANAVLLAVVALGLGTRTFNLNQSLFVDEAWVANAVLADTLRDMFHYDWVPAPPPLFLLLVRAAVSVLGPSDVAFRMVPVLAAMGAILLLALLARRLLGATSAILSVTLLVASPVAYRWAVSLKQYSSDAFAALLLIWLIYRYLDRPAWRNYLLLAGGYAVCLLLSYPAVFFIPCGLYALTLSGWRAREGSSGLPAAHLSRVVVFSLLMLAEVYLIYAAFVRPNVTPELTRFWFSDFPAGSGIRPALSYLVHRWPGFASGFPPGEPRVEVAVAIVLVVALGALRSLVSLLRRDPEAAHLFVIGASVCLALSAAGALRRYPVSEERTSLFLLPLLILWFVLGLRVIGDGLAGGPLASKHRDRIALAVRWACPAAVLVFFFAHVLRYRPTEEDKAAVTYLLEHVDRDDALYVHASMFEQFRFYRGRRVRQDTLAVYFGDTGWRCCTRHNETHLKTMDYDFLRNDLLSFLATSPARRRWFLFIDRPGDWGGRDDPRLFREILENRQCRQEAEKRFTGVLIRAYRCAA
ncbi:MAG TPA: glycosyltransferase family 39 protein [Gemmatimonadales bacterium]|jgi:4-amino-4-deoxy-L-arabinose transferase-like glycosyltransferase|nr:glycosyltransferase family 39 protein [Gemmatimonadales bacterium]